MRVHIHQNKPPSLFITFSILALMFAVFFFSNGFYTIEAGRVGVVSTFGKLSEEPSLPGLHFKIPAMQKIRELDVKMQTVIYQGDLSVKQKDGVIHEPKITFLDSKNLEIGMAVTIQFVPDSGRVKYILEKYGDNYFKKLIDPIVRDLVRDVGGQFPAEGIAINRSLIAAQLTTKLEEKFKELPFFLSGVQLRNIDLPDMVRSKIEDVQLAKQEEQRLAMVQKQKEQDKKNRIIEAEAENAKKKIEADANAYKTKTEAQAKAEANLVISKSITGELLQYEVIRRWSGDYPKVLMGEKDSAKVLLGLPQLDLQASK